MHARQVTSLFPVRMCIPSESHSHSLMRMNHNGINILTGNGDMPHQEWRCASLGMHILNKNAQNLHRVIKLIDNNDSSTFRPVSIMIVAKAKINAFWIMLDHFGSVTSIEEITWAGSGLKSSLLRHLQTTTA